MQNAMTSHLAPSRLSCSSHCLKHGEHSSVAGTRLLLLQDQQRTLSLRACRRTSACSSPLISCGEAFGDALHCNHCIAKCTAFTHHLLPPAAARCAAARCSRRPDWSPRQSDTCPLLHQCSASVLQTPLHLRSMLLQLSLKQAPLRQPMSLQ